MPTWWACSDGAHSNANQYGFLPPDIHREEQVANNESSISAPNFESALRVDLITFYRALWVTAYSKHAWPSAHKPYWISTTVTGIVR